jgi:hypothetical protein
MKLGAADGAFLDWPVEAVAQTLLLLFRYYAASPIFLYLHMASGAAHGLDVCISAVAQPHWAVQ